MLATFFQYALYAVVLVTVLSILVAAHEYGHYIFARLFGMGAEEFAIGMGKPRLLTWLRRTYTIPLPADTPYREGEVIESLAVGVQAQGASNNLEKADKTMISEVVRTPDGLALAETTEFTIRPWPVGGFVRIKGMMPEEDGSETMIPGGFYSKPPWQRLIVLFAGPAFSIIAGILVFMGLFMSVGKADASAPVIGAVVKNQAAWNAGLRPDDRVVSIDGKPVTRFFDIVSTVRFAPGREFLVEYERNGNRNMAKVSGVQEETPSPILDEHMEPTGETAVQAKLGLVPDVKQVKLGAREAWVESWRAPVKVVKNLWNVIRKPAIAKETMGGPGTIAVKTSEAVDQGLISVFSLAGGLSISVGIMNLLPIFPLDGGQMMVAIAEMLRGGRRLSLRVQNMVGTIGFALVMMLFACMLLIDFNRYLGPKPAEPKKVELEFSTKSRP